MGSGKEVAEVNSVLFSGLAKWTPGEKATPWRASFHQSYLGRPMRGAPRLWLVGCKLEAFSCWFGDGGMREKGKKVMGNVLY